MSIERIFYCDAADCEVYIQTADRRPTCPGWLTVTETGDSRSLTFCTWDCLMKYAAQFPPPEIIGVEPGGA